MRTTLLQRAAALATTLGLTSLGLLGAGAAPAQAATSDCPKGYFCGWANDDGTGSTFKTKTSVPTLGSWDNKIRLRYNRTGLNVCFFDKPNYEGFGAWDTPDEIYPISGAEADYSSIKISRTLRECETDPYPYWETATSPKALGFGDMNGDRRADAVLRDEAGRLWLMPGNGTGRLIGNGGWNAMNALVRHGDFSRDGREDVIASEKATGKLWLYPGTGSGGLGTRKLIGNGGWNSMGRLAAFGDLTGDGRSDLLGVEKATGKLWLYPGTGSGGLGARKLIGTGGWNGMNALVGAGDMTGDGRADLVAREKATGKLWLYPGTSTRTLGARKLIGTGGWNSMDHILGVGDTSGDGRPDLEASDGSSLYQYQGLATGGLRKVDLGNGTWWALEGATAF
ncbi:FG-GAP-like repeat-containing protein [Actinacidiphila glaucinigra]|uniref:FG-GAP-like repeat-containing protein n=1 Tax=Actinacidiphila glaucinigra TaxID=235986 RepID=UPI002DD9E6F9|nr:FG-GAP-like repeat-containing protein [Actinacidiphila glaucinigra]WSD61873.1 FG-GAP-like repeat-containing protein [Actinacidiphila glaucinigra]